jgi:uncharacterized membrane protein YbaN (DUF454 family)
LKSPDITRLLAAVRAGDVCARDRLLESVYDELRAIARRLLANERPTTVFILAASWCFSRSSPRFAAWLRGHAWLGPKLQRFAGSGGMPRSAKRLALGSMWIAVAMSSLLLAGTHPNCALVTVASAVLGTLTILFVVPTVSS